MILFKFKMNKDRNVNNKKDRRVGMIKNDKRHFCRWCRVWMPNDSAVLLFYFIIQTIANHEGSKSHKMKSAKFILQQQIVQQHIEEEKQRTIETLKHIQKEAERQVAGDVYRKTPAFMNNNIGKKEDPDDIYANFKSNGECAMGDYLDEPVKPKQPKQPLFTFQMSSIPPPPPSTPPPDSDSGFIPPPPSYPPPKPKLEPDHSFKIARRQPPAPVNGEIYHPISDYAGRVILGCLVKSINTKDVWKDAILVNIGEKKVEGTVNTVIPKYTVVDVISEKQYELIGDQIYLLESELNKCIEMNNELSKIIEYNNDNNNNNVVWKRGMQCQARYSVDFQWYPAIIINTNKDITYVTAVFAGYLNKETLPVSFILPLNVNPESMKKEEEMVDGHEVVDIVYYYYIIYIYCIAYANIWRLANYFSKAINNRRS